MTMSMKSNIKAVQIEQIDAKPFLKNITIDELKKNHVLIKMKFTPINPFDRMFIDGYYPGSEKVPRVVGLEGSGVIEEVGDDLKVPLKVGDRVCFFYPGAWANYAVVPSDYVFKLPQEVKFEDAALAIINPFTVELMVKLIKDAGHKAVVHTAASSSIGKLLIKRLRHEDIKLINLVRDKDALKEIEPLNPEFVINIEDKDWFNDLRKTARQLDAKLVFDCVAGDVGSKVFDVMPYGTTLFNFGSLSCAPVIITPRNLIFEDKKIRGMWVEPWIEMLGVEGRQNMAKQIFNRLKDELKTEIEKVFSLQEFDKALDFLDKNKQHHDKILLRLDA